jgi:hypothetical protein
LAIPSNYDGDFIPVIVSRQRGGRGKRPHSRELGVFMKEMVNFMHRRCGNPRYDFVAKLSNVAFLDADVGAEDVRQSCRRRRTGTPGG